jgi:hypothetical protein
MTTQSLKTTIAAAILLFVCIGAVSGTTITAHGGTILSTGATADFPITVDSLPDGLSGFFMTVTISDPSKAEITKAITPSWADISLIGGNLVSGPNEEQSVMADSVGIMTVTLNENYYPAPNLTLVTLRIRGDALGSTGFQVTGVDIEDKDGTSIAATVQNGTIIIGAQPTTSATTIPTTAPTTAPTTEPTTVTTTAPTTAPTTEPITGPTNGQTTVPTTEPTTVPTTEPIMIPSAGSIDVQSIPDGGDVYLDGDLVGVTPVVIDSLSPGQYTVLIQKDGYEPFENASVMVSEGNTTQVSAVLELKSTSGTTGMLDITSTPVDAKVYLDDTYQGKTSLLITNLDPGSYMLRIDKEGYNSWYQGITIVAGETTFVNAPLTPTPTDYPTATPTPTPTSTATGGVFVVSEPTATVFIDGVERGKSNDVIEKVPAGIRNVTLFKAGYLPKSIMVNIPIARVTVTQKIILEAGEGSTPPTTIPPSMPTTIPTTTPTTPVTTVSTTAGPYPPIPTTGGLFVYSVPFGCSVFVDDVYLGVSPNLFNSLSPGTHSLKVTLPGYEDNVRPVTVHAGDITMVTVIMAPDFGALVSAFS